MRLLSTLTLVVSLFTAPAWPQAAAPKAATTGLFDKIAVIGASVSAGYGIDVDGERESRSSDAGLADIIEASLKTEHQKILARASSLFFMDPDANGKSAVKKATAHEPTLLVALDFLFWYGYGPVDSEDARLAGLDRGLDQLKGFTCPILLGDIPDMSISLEAPAPMLRKEWVPAKETLAKLNERIEAYAKEHSNVVLVPIAALVGKIQRGDAFSLRGTNYEKGALIGMLQEDRLHATLEGTCALWVTALDTLLKARPQTDPATLRFDIKGLAADVAKTRKAEIEKQKAAKKARDDERRRRAAEKAESRPTSAPAEKT